VVNATPPVVPGIKRCPDEYTKKQLITLVKLTDGGASDNRFGVSQASVSRLIIHGDDHQLIYTLHQASATSNISIVVIQKEQTSSLTEPMGSWHRTLVFALSERRVRLVH